MVEYQYAKGRIAQSIQFLSEELKEFDEEYANKQRNVSKGVEIAEIDRQNR